MRQAAVVAAHLGENATALRAVAPLDGDTESLEVVRIGPYPATLVRPSGGESAPAVIVFVPSEATRANDRDIARLQHALAAAGIVGWAIRVPSTDRILAPGAANQVVDQVVRYVASDAGTRRRHVSIIAAGPVASLALRSAARSDPAADVRAVIAVQPIADLRVLIRRALTDATFDPETRRAAGRALARAARARVDERSRITLLLFDRAIASNDPIRVLRAIPPQAAPVSLRGIFETLRASTPEQFDAAWPRVPDAVRAAVERSSALPIADRIDARVVLVADSRPGSVTGPDVVALGARLKDARTITVDGSNAASSVDLRELFGVSAWWLQRAGA
jgi:hypothetical protein